MSQIEGVVYAPPANDYPAVIVFFGPDGDILAAHASETLEAAQTTLVSILKQVQARLDEEGHEAIYDEKTRANIVSTYLQ
ncbi:hypothetical protein [Methylocystis bryophila]|uniref:Uncharacterized protein n=1 Tax=Methylocystis bryophila TaxID=655015 RepID=A0A1W6MY73_9HYPH|nr:hypothetical protein [Methylocystis bryophila]ARN82542.1 hypothetical protein B1812_17240 [Methylocystis bryophila]BDV38746.1 hypothetical protein DSM21852_19990 [Methylocystis bryophila]